MPRAVVAAVAVIGLPVLLPAMALAAAASAWARRLRWVQDGPRAATWYWRVWWFYGYHGLYQIDWWMKRRAA